MTTDPTQQARGADPMKSWTGPSVSRRDVGGPEGKAPYAAQPMVLTDEERAIMKECENESFWQRALPFSMGSMFAAQMLVKSGRWQPHPKFGGLPKAIICGGLGFIVGKVAYLPVCQEKILQKIPQSNLAAAVRKSRNVPEPEEASVPLEDTSRASQSTPLGGQPSFAGLDDRFRPSLNDRDVKLKDEPEEAKPKMSYEELRRRNRQQSGESPIRRTEKTPFMSQSLPSEDQEDNLGPPPTPRSPPRSEQPQRKKRTNMWGDVIED